MRVRVMAATFCRSAEACLMSQNLPASLTYAVSQKKTKKTRAAGLARVVASAPDASAPTALLALSVAALIYVASRGAQAATAMTDLVRGRGRGRGRARGRGGGRVRIRGRGRGRGRGSGQGQWSGSGSVVRVRVRVCG